MHLIMSPNSSYFASLFLSSSIPIMIVDGTRMPLASVGFVVTPNMSLSHVYHILKLALNLAFVGQLCDYGNLVTFSSSSCYVHDLQSQKLIGIGHKKGGLYVLDELKESATTVVAASVDLSSFHLSLSSSSFYL